MQCSILIVEDDAICSLYAATLLEHLGHAVTEKATGRDALEELKRMRYEVVVLDYQLPGMNGLELARRIRAVTDTRAAIIMASAARLAADTLADAGVDGFLPKPFTPAQLASALDACAKRPARYGASASPSGSVVCDPGPAIC